jgi:transposase
MESNLISLRVDELPLLHQLIGELGIKTSIDAVIGEHGNWSGISIGRITELWLCYILSECDHRLQNVEDWSESRLDLLRILSDDSTLSSLDFTDDKLGLLLDKIGDSRVWGEIEQKINEKSLSVYRLGDESDLATFRLDAAPMQSHGQVEAGGLLQYGYHKHHADLPQFKVKLCTLDNELNHFAYPVTHLTVSGNTSDDELYIPIIKQSKTVLSGILGYEKGNLYVGDSKFGSIENRAYVFKGGDYYLLPLSLVQFSQKEREDLISKSDKTTYIEVIRKEGEENIKIAAGFETLHELEYELEGEKLSWSERRLFVHSTAYAKSQQHGFDNRLEKVVAQLEDLPTRKQGKKNLISIEEYQETIDKLLKDNNLEGFLGVEIQSTETTKELRAYGSKGARSEITRTFSVIISKNEVAIEAHKSLLGWQVYATNAPKALLGFEKCVLKYRHQSNIESSFDDLRNKVAHLVPIYLQKDERIKGLVNLLLLALKVCAVLEYKIAEALSKSDEELRHVYEGNPKRGTKRPSSKRIFKAFDGISIALVFVNYQLQFAIMTQLEPVQLKILKLLNIEKDIYTNLAEKIQIFFSEKIISET